MKLGALLRMGAFFISESIFNKPKGECSEALGEGWPRKFLRYFVNGSGKRKKVFYENSVESPKYFWSDH